MGQIKSNVVKKAKKLPVLAFFISYIENIFKSKKWWLENPEWKFQANIRKKYDNWWELKGQSLAWFGSKMAVSDCFQDFDLSKLALKPHIR